MSPHSGPPKPKCTASLLRTAKDTTRFPVIGDFTLYKSVMIFSSSSYLSAGSTIPYSWRPFRLIQISAERLAMAVVLLQSTSRVSFPFSSVFTTV